MVNIIDLFQNVADVDIDKALISKECGVSHILAFLPARVLSGIYIIIGDTVITKVDVKCGIMDALLKLIATYYILDLNYPNAYSIMITIFQTFVMEKPYKQSTKKDFKVMSIESRSNVLQLDTSTMDFTVNA